MNDNYKYKKAFEVGKEAHKILNDYPDLTYKEAIERAKEVINNGATRRDEES